jgi:tripartite-type tricarboxylate transporter receptor subunit TctC
MAMMKSALSRRAMMSLMAGAAAGTGVLEFTSPAFADYPDRPVKVIVPFTPGGPTDVMGRVIATKLSENMGKQFYVDNLAGAGGNIGVGAAARSAPDGYTMLCVASHFVINPGLYATITYDAVKDFAPITIAGESPHAYIAHPSLPAKNMKEMIELIKGNPGKYSYASPGTGTGPHLSAELLKLTFNLDLTAVPFRGAGQAVQSVLGGFNPIGCVALPPAIELIKAGQIKCLGVTGLRRFPTLPDSPTLAEQGIGDQEGTTIGAFLVPAATKKEIVDLLYKEIAKIVASPGMKDRFIEIGFTPVVNTPDEFAKMIKTEVERWKRVIKEANVEIIR